MGAFDNYTGWAQSAKFRGIPAAEVMTSKPVAACPPFIKEGKNTTFSLFRTLLSAARQCSPGMALRLPSFAVLDPAISSGKASPSSASRCCPLPSRLRYPNVSHGLCRPLPLRGASAGVVVPHAVMEDQKPSSLSVADDAGTADDAPSSSAPKDVLVVGATGGVGQLVVASLLDRNIKSRLLLRDPEKAALLFGRHDEDTLKIWKGDTRNSADLDPAIFEGVTHVICCTGTTAFPSRRWDGDNTPEKVDWEGVRNLVSALPPTLKRLVLVSSVGVTKFNELPWSIMNLFGVLKFKKMGEDIVRSSGIPFTIIRAGRLTDGPYTSYDLNTLLKATAGERRAVIIGQGDKLMGEVSRLVVAEACIQALDIEFTEGQIYEINSVKGEGPGSNHEKWKELFKAAQINQI